LGSYKNLRVNGLIFFGLIGRLYHAGVHTYFLFGYKI
jgi:hypothetical protein